MTLAQTRSVIETRMAVSGKSIDEHNEILGLDAALKYINASLVQRYFTQKLISFDLLIRESFDSFLAFTEMMKSPSKTY